MAFDGVAAAEQQGGEFEVVVGNGFADAGAAGGFALDEKRFDLVHGEPFFRADGLEQGRIAETILAEGPARPHDDEGELRENAEEFVDEGAGGKFARGRVEGQGDDFGNSGLEKEFAFLPHVAEPLGGALGGDDLERVRFEGEDGRGAAIRRGLEQVGDKLAVAAMESVKHADSHVREAGLRGQFAQGLGDVGGEHVGIEKGSPGSIEVQARRMREISGSERMNGASSGALWRLCNFSQEMARSREKLPDLMRDNWIRCAPQPSFCPMS